MYETTPGYIKISNAVSCRVRVGDGVESGHGNVERQVQGVQTDTPFAASGCYPAPP